MDADATWARAAAFLAALHARRQARVDAALTTLSRVRAVLAWHRIAGRSWGWGPPARFPSLAGELELEHLALEGEHAQN